MTLLLFTKFVMAFKYTWPTTFFNKIRCWWRFHKTWGECVFCFIISWTNSRSRSIFHTLSLKSVHCQRLVVLHVAPAFLNIKERRLIVTRLFFFSELVDWRKFRIPNFVSVFVPLLLHKLSFDGWNTSRIGPRTGVEGRDCWGYRIVSTCASIKSRFFHLSNFS